MTKLNERLRKLTANAHNPEFLYHTGQDAADLLDECKRALSTIDALDPEEHVYGCSADALRGLVLQMGQTARATLNKLRAAQEKGR